MNIALVLSGGTGTRLGEDIPKQYIEICGKPIIFYCLECLALHEEIDAMQIVADKAWHDFIMECWERFTEKKVPMKCKGFSAPGNSRQLSILNGLRDIRSYADDSDYVLIHDAARPLLSHKQITSCLDAAKQHEGAVPVLPMKDTVYQSMDGKTITSLLDRSKIFAGQAPEVFKLGVYYTANVRLLPEQILNINGSAEPAFLSGMDTVLIPGDENNFKITTKKDLKRFQERMYFTEPECE